MTLLPKNSRIRHLHAIALPQGRALTDFVIAQEGGPLAPARTRIDGDSVLVWSDQVSRPAEVRYGWENAARHNLREVLISILDLPESAFLGKKQAFSLFF